MPNAKIHVKTCAAGRVKPAAPKLSELKALPETHQRRQAYEDARRRAQARAPVAPAHEARFAPLAQVFGLDGSRREAKSA
jgi:hypothetical protein